MTDVNTNPDYIHSTNYRTTGTTTGAEATAAEQAYENTIVDNINDHSAQLSQISYHVQSGTALTADDVEVLRDCAGDLTWSDLKGLADDGLITEDQAELLMATNTLAYSDLGVAGDSNAELDNDQIAAALNRLYGDLSEDDRDFVLENFKNQGNYARVFNVDTQGTEDDTSDDEYSYTLTNQIGSVIDLPSTAEIDRAILFLTSSDQTVPKDDDGNIREGAVKAFVNWDFPDSYTEVATYLGNLNAANYDNLPANAWDSIAFAITRAGDRATDVDTNTYVAQTTSTTAFQAAQDDLDAQQERSDIALALLDEINLAGGKNLDGRDLMIPNPGGETKKMTEWIQEIGMKYQYQNRDHNQDLSEHELYVIRTTLNRTAQVAQAGVRMDQFIMSGASDEQIADVQQSFYDYANAVSYQNSMLAMNRSGHGVDFGWTGHEDEGGQFAYMTMWKNDPNQGWVMEKVHTFDQYMKDQDSLIYAGDSSKGYDGPSDGDKSIAKWESGGMYIASTAYAENMENRFEMSMVQTREGMPGYDAAFGEYQDAVDLKENTENCVGAMVMAMYRENHGSIDMSTVKFRNADGDMQTCASWMADNATDEMKEAVFGSSANITDASWSTHLSADQVTSLNDYLQGNSHNTYDDIRQGNTTSNTGYWFQLQKDIDEKKEAVEALTPETEDDRDTSVHRYASAQVYIPRVMTDDAWDDVIAGNPQAVDENGDPVSVDPQQLRSMTGYSPESSEDLDISDATEQDFDVNRSGQIIDSDGHLVTDENGNVPLTYDELVEQYNQGVDLQSLYGISDGDVIDLGMLMYCVMNRRMSMLGNQIQDITREQAKNTNDQANVNAITAKLNSASGDVNLDTTMVTMADGSTTSLYNAMRLYDIAPVGSDHTLSGDEIDRQVENVKDCGAGLGREGQQIMNELTQLSQKYQQAITEMMNFLEKTDALKQKIIDKIRAN